MPIERVDRATRSKIVVGEWGESPVSFDSEIYWMKKLTMATIDKGTPIVDHQRLGQRRLAR